MGYAIIRDGKSIELTNGEIYAAYRCQENMFRMQDARSHINELIINELVKNEVNEGKINKLKKLNESDIEILVERFLDKYDCNYDENTLWERVINNYIT